MAAGDEKAGKTIMIVIGPHARILSKPPQRIKRRGPRFLLQGRVFSKHGNRLPVLRNGNTCPVLRNGIR